MGLRRCLCIRKYQIITGSNQVKSSRITDDLITGHTKRGQHHRSISLFNCLLCFNLSLSLFSSLLERKLSCCQLCMRKSPSTLTPSHVSFPSLHHLARQVAFACSVRAGPAQSIFFLLFVRLLVAVWGEVGHHRLINLSSLSVHRRLIESSSSRACSQASRLSFSSSAHI